MFAIDPLTASKTLRLNAGSQILFSSVLGALMLLPLQSWFPWKAPGKMYKDIGAAHLDWFMLAFMQCAAASILDHHIHLDAQSQSDISLVTKLMIFGGWMNPTAYVFRGFGVDAFVLGGSKTQIFAALLGGISSTSIIFAWTKLLILSRRQ